MAKKDKKSGQKSANTFETKSNTDPSMGTKKINLSGSHLGKASAGAHHVSNKYKY